MYIALDRRRLALVSTLPGADRLLARQERRKVTISKVIWCDRGFQPHFFGFCPDETAWKRLLRSFNHPTPVAYPISAGACSIFDHSNGKSSSVVTIAQDVDKRCTKQEIVGLIVHEATHVYQHVLESMDEKNPSVEFEAYQMQGITQALLAAYETSRKKLFLR